MATTVATVQCPECGRNWTGHFDDSKSVETEKTVCKDCKAKH